MRIWKSESRCSSTDLAYCPSFVRCLAFFHNGFFLLPLFIREVVEVYESQLAVVIKTATASRQHILSGDLVLVQQSLDHAHTFV